MKNTARIIAIVFLVTAIPLYLFFNKSSEQRLIEQFYKENKPRSDQGDIHDTYHFTYVQQFHIPDNTILEDSLYHVAKVKEWGKLVIVDSVVSYTINHPETYIYDVRIDVKTKSGTTYHRSYIMTVFDGQPGFVGDYYEALDKLPKTFGVPISTNRSYRPHFGSHSANYWAHREQIDPDYQGIQLWFRIAKEVEFRNNKKKR